MRRWIDHLISHQAAYNDFIAHMDEYAAQMSDRALKALIEQDPKAVVYATEAEFWKTIKKTVKKEYDEKVAQTKYQSVMNERN